MDAQDFRSLQEAYIGVYDDDIREKLEFESWLNNLLEEGYDLSDYTWDELYENYIQLDEISDRRVQKTLQARQRRFNRSIDSGAPNKEFHQLRKTEKLVASRNKRTGSNIKVDENHQLDEISDRLANAAINARTKRTDRLRNRAGSILPRSDSDQRDISNQVTKSSNKEAKVNTTISARNKRTGSNIEPIFTRRHESYDLYDIILSHLINEGYADTQEEAEHIMVNMSEDWRESIVETRMDPRGRPASGPMNVYANPKGKPSQARLDAIKSYEDEQRKKTPEQRKKELDDYRERQMNNK